MKDRKVLLESEIEKFQLGEVYFIYDQNNQKKGSVRLVNVRKKRAIGEYLGEGDAVVGNKAYVQKIETAMIQKPEISKVVSQKNEKFQSGLGFKYAINELSVLQKVFSGASETVKMTGSNLGVSGFLGYKITEAILLKAVLGYEIYDIKGQSLQNLCSGNSAQNCFVKTNYLTSGGQIIYEMGNLLSLGLGGVFKYAASSDSNAIFIDDLKMKGSINLEIGTKYEFDKKNFIPIFLGYEYSLNTSTDVPVNSQIYLNFGYGWSW